MKGKHQYQRERVHIVHDGSFGPPTNSVLYGNTHVFMPKIDRKEPTNLFSVATGHPKNTLKYKIFTSWEANTKHFI